MSNPQLAMMIKRLKKRCAQRLERIKQLEAERDAAVADLRVARHCRTCKNSGCDPSDQPCRSCGIVGENYKWRGVKEEER